MKLTRLELSGFKSFADTVSLYFDEGVTSIVGPNGCGKSNVSDAVRWVLGEQSARLLRGGKMEDVIFQGSTSRRPVNVTEVSLFLDNSDGTLPISFREVVITRRLSRSGISEYLLNNSATRLRDIQDLLRGTGLGSDAGVVIEAKMIDLLLSDRAEERRSLFEEAAGIGLYRNRKESTERRLEETAQDLQRVEDLVAEVQSQLRSLARQRGKAERHEKLSEEKFAVQLTLARRHLDGIEEALATISARRESLAHELPAAKAAVTRHERHREGCARERGAVESQRTEIARRLGAARVELGKLDGDLALAAERLGNIAARRVRAGEERAQMQGRMQHAAREREASTADRTTADAEHQRIQSELTARATAEQHVRTRLVEERAAVRTGEESLLQHAQTLRALEGERSALEGELASLREQRAQADARLAALRTDASTAESRRTDAAAAAERTAGEARRAAAETERARHFVAEARRREALERAERRQAEEIVAQVTARRQALEELERDRVGLAPGAAALLAQRERFDGIILGPLSDFVQTDRTDADVAERLLGEFLNAVLVRDGDAIARIQAWHAEAQPGQLVLLPLNPGPAVRRRWWERLTLPALDRRLRVDARAVAWVQALVGGSEVLDSAGTCLRRSNGAVYLTGTTAPSGPLRRRAEIASLTQEVAAAETQLAATDRRLAATVAELANLEGALERSSAAAEQAREQERTAVAAREDAARLMGTLGRELADSEIQKTALAERLSRAEHRLAEIDAALTEAELAQAKLNETVGAGRASLSALEHEQETAREARVHWQVQEAQLAARLQGIAERMARAEEMGSEADAARHALEAELAGLENETTAITAQQAHWSEARAERRVTLLELEAANADVDEALQEAEEALAVAEAGLTQDRARLEALSEEFHRLDLELAEAAARRRSIVDRVETEWRRPIENLLAEAPMLDLDLESLELESARITEALEAIGPVNPLAVEEHAEESKRLEFLSTQRDDLVAARHSLTQAIREIDGTARQMFVETFQAVQANFSNVFQTLFGGGECELRLANPDEPLESEIDIHAAPRGKRTQRIHLLSSGERTLVATSLLFAIYLTKPSPFCLMDEVDAPLDDANVGRFTRLLDEFKKTTQFIVITHNPRTMQAADAVYGVTMQEPGVSTIVGVRLGEREVA